MAKSCNQKGKILYLQKMLSETTSQKPVTMQEILAKLEEQGIRADQACMSEFYKEKNPAYLWIGDFLQNKGGG